MPITDRFSRSNNARDQLHNKELAKEIVTHQDQHAVDEIIELFGTENKVDTLADALKVIEMIGEEEPSLVKNAFPETMILLNHNQSKIQWRAMCVLSKIADFHLNVIFDQLGTILKVMEAGSVITRDHGVKILILLYQNEDFREVVTALLEEQLMTAPDNQLGQYAEKWLEVIETKHLSKLGHQLEKRQTDLTHPSHQKRISRVLKKLNKTQHRYQP